MPSALKSILIFPASIEQSLQYYRKTHHQGITVVGASSLEPDPAAKLFENWVRLPYISDEKFEKELLNTISTYNIGGIYTPHMAIWGHLERLLEKISPDGDVTLVNTFPFDEEIGEFDTAIEFAQELHSSDTFVDSCLTERPKLSTTEAAAIFHHAKNIYGQCAREKILAMCDMARSAPRGDLIEVGVFCGKSAFILAWLAKHYSVGNLLCVDPWSFEEALEQDDDTGILADTAPRLDLSYAKKLFEINILPFSENHINFLQTTSVLASKQYTPGFEVSGTAFGKTQYKGEIAVLHIDGNHAYEAVRLDLESWFPKLISGGWIIMDDYTWPFGDGPKRAADEFLAKNKERVLTYSIAGGALFIKTK
ncbi:MAG: class I SAM-dependent methyltransferase [Gammaproteobacteria bacterium]|jgi:hypothetical protein|nr:class I SAM-dependent methyltransferase [Gammaproteobacteria bacterium]MBT5280158.1 class I SAM-dependent methyltransferase [Euryarchaeota archaeon]MBT3870028.1 class I SAM-dependent methyltransferase [Gammaproteobacteria bacterium]MBT4379908.1 class I SAM-dependent methyltransferase [Gammaproteobacteria bacterium]MBT4616032.1 class I SAM-dependent methyltransferase [Gammaproteobacteria bacterium]